MQRTNTTIIFPDAGDPNIPPIRSVFLLFSLTMVISSDPRFTGKHL